MASKNASMDKTSVTIALARPYEWIYSIVIGLFLIFVWMALVNITFIASIWPHGGGLQAITAILEHDAAFAPQPLATWLADWSYAALFKFSGIHDVLIAATTPGAKLSAVDDALVNGLLLPHADEIAILMQSARLIGIRAALLVEILTIALPLLGAAIVDGLAQRYVRRECAGRESSGLYHRVKYVLLVGGLVIAMIYLTTPIGLHPRWLFPWVATATLLVFLQTKFYKKYL
jgi:hypothetical protein